MSPWPPPPAVSQDVPYRGWSLSLGPRTGTLHREPSAVAERLPGRDISEKETFISLSTECRGSVFKTRTKGKSRFPSAGNAPNKVQCIRVMDILYLRYKAVPLFRTFLHNCMLQYLPFGNFHALTHPFRAPSDLLRVNALIAAAPPPASGWLLTAVSDAPPRVCVQGCVQGYLRGAPPWSCLPRATSSVKSPCRADSKQLCTRMTLVWPHLQTLGSAARHREDGEHRPCGQNVCSFFSCLFVF